MVPQAPEAATSVADRYKASTAEAWGISTGCPSNMMEEFTWIHQKAMDQCQNYGCWSSQLAFWCISGWPARFFLKDITIFDMFPGDFLWSSMAFWWFSMAISCHKQTSRVLDCDRTSISVRRFRTSRSFSFYSPMYTYIYIIIHIYI